MLEHASFIAMHVFLFDGTYELFRMFFGAPPTQAPDGREVGAVRGLLRSLHSFLQRHDGPHVAIAFDQRIESFRNELFDGYKTGAGIESALLAQFPLAEQAASALGLTVWPMVDLEADDALASGAAALAAHPDVERVHICTPDKDMAQCVRGQEVVLYDHRKDAIIDEEGVWQKWGVAARSIPDYLGLVGDSADGIPGLPRWGAKSTATVLGHYGHIEQIPASAEDWEVKVRGATKLAEILAAHQQEAMLYRKLATLVSDAPLLTREGRPLSDHLEGLRWRGAVRSALEPLCQELGERRLCDEISKWHPAPNA